MTRYAGIERQQLSDLLLAVGPDAPTLCEGWATRDLAAHIVVRERLVWAPAALVVKPLARRAGRIRLQQAARPYRELVADVRRAPWWSPLSNPLVSETVNTLEFFIHHEDVRRGRDGWEPRELDPDLEAYLFRRAGQIARMALRRMRATVALNSPGYGEIQVGADTPQARLTGAPGELVLFLSGRQRASRVQVDGTVPLADRLRTARLGL